MGETAIDSVLIDDLVAELAKNNPLDCATKAVEDLAICDHEKSRLTTLGSLSPRNKSKSIAAKKCRFVALFDKPMCRKKASVQ